MLEMLYVSIKEKQEDLIVKSVFDNVLGVFKRVSSPMRQMGFVLKRALQETFY